MQSFLIQTSPFTFRTNRCFGKLFSPLLRCRRSIFLLQHLNILHHPFVSDKIIRRSTDQRAFDFYTIIGTIQHFFNCIIRQFLYWGLQCCIVFFQQSTDLPEDHSIFIFSQRCYGSFINGLFTVGNHFIHINLIDYSQPFTLWTRSLRRVK